MTKKRKIIIAVVFVTVIILIGGAVIGYINWSLAKKAEFAATPIDKKSEPREITYYIVRGIIRGENGELPLRKRGVAIYCSPRPVDSLTVFFHPSDYADDVDGGFHVFCNTAAPTYLSFCFEGYETVMNVKFTPQVRRLANASVEQVLKHVKNQKIIVMKEKKQKK